MKSLKMGLLRLMATVAMVYLQNAILKWSDLSVNTYVIKVTGTERLKSETY